MDLRLQMVFEAIDRATGPVNRIAQAVQAPGRAAMGAVQAASGALNQLSASFGTVASAIGGGIAVRDVVKDNDAYRRMEILSGASKEAVDRLRHGIYDTAIAWRVQTSDMNAAVAAMRSNGAGIDAITGNLDNLGAAIQILGGHGEELGTMMAQLRTHLKIETPSEMLQVIATMRDQLKGIPDGIDNFAEALARLASDYAKMGHTGPGAAREIGAIYAITARGAGNNARLARSATENILGLATSKEGREVLESLAIDPYPRDARGRRDTTRTRDVTTLLMELLKRYRENPYVVGQLLPGSLEKDLKTLLPGLDAQGNSPLLKEKLGVKGDAEKFAEDARKVGQSFQGALNLLRATLARMADVSLSGPLERLASVLAHYADVIAPAVAALGGFFILSVIVNQIGQATMFLFGLARALGLVTAAQWLLNVALTANPIGLVIVGLAALAAAAVALYVYWEPFRTFWQGLWSDVQAAFDQSFVGGVLQVLATFTPVPLIAKGLEALVEYLFGFSLKEAGRALFASLWDGVREQWDAMTGWVMQQIERLRALIAQIPGLGGAKPTYGRDIRGAIESQQRQAPPLAFGPDGAGAQGQPGRAEIGGQITVRFENAPSGTRVEATDMPGDVRLNTDLGYGYGPN